MCSCLPGLKGDPTLSCHPECITNSECPTDQACVSHKCVNPCVGVCGRHATCRVVLHAPICSCDASYIGDPYSLCQPVSCKIP